MSSWTPTEYQRRVWASHRLARAEYDRAHAEDLKHEAEERDRVTDEEERNSENTLNEWGHKS